jgi:site-specific recombinase XerD
VYPFVRTVGDAILRYLKEARPLCPCREIFVTVKAPVQPLSNSAIWQRVSQRLRALNLPLRHCGPHALRHACASHLLSEGLSLQEIGNHLGHRSPAATAHYAKVDLLGLRQVADFSLGALL